MKYTELNIRKKRKNEYLITIDVYESLDNYIHTIAKDFFIESLGDTISYLSLLSEIDPEVRSGVEGRGNLTRRFRAAKHGSLVFSIRWDGSYLERLPHEAANEERPGARIPPMEIIWERIPCLSDEPKERTALFGWNVSWLHGIDWKGWGSNDGEIR